MRKFGANYLKAISAVIESLCKQEDNKVHSSGKKQAALLTSVCQPAQGKEQLHARAAPSPLPCRALCLAKHSCPVAEQLPPKLTLLRYPAQRKAITLPDAVPVMTLLCQRSVLVLPLDSHR